MRLPLELEALLLSMAVSFVTAAFAMAVIRGEPVRRYAGALGFGFGYLAGYAWQETRQLLPTLSWHWIPWLSLGLAFIGPVVIASGVRTLERWALATVVALVAAFLLVPTRQSLQPWRTTYMAITTACLVMEWNLIDPLIRRTTGRALAGALAATSFNTSALIAVMVSLRIGSLTAIGMGALAGGIAVTLWYREGTALRGLLPSHCVVLCGVLLVAHLGDGFPRTAPVLILIAPLMLWLFEAGPLSRLTGRTASISKGLAVLTPLIAAWFV